ncbi:hypothetical protein ATCV1_Z097R [Acanthocystis turfacea chlorella virus 1]|uniref:Uncharacterized protein Z097R n=1 Tax=Chlorovirus heliozoae TaxID=322019 RepID=A7K857_9PHYC|nr:hypothetical protein ATCV1_Z097R [Acanthocystis turfacea chlorella virus 1]ABT16231.1 hypothetical protein ATCV1_Z097R [Acanthocystis turfacea chlorella virus 1]
MCRYDSKSTRRSKFHDNVEPVVVHIFVIRLVKDVTILIMKLLGAHYVGHVFRKQPSKMGSKVVFVSAEDRDINLFWERANVWGCTKFVLQRGVRDVKPAQWRRNIHETPVRCETLWKVDADCIHLGTPLLLEVNELLYKCGCHRGKEIMVYAELCVL